MAFSSMRPWLAGVAIAVSMAGTAHAQDAKTVFEARYAELGAAVLAKDTAALSKVFVPEYQLTDIMGNTYNLPDFMERMAKLPSDPSRPSKTTLISATITGDTAQVKLQRTMHTSRPSEDGTVMEFDITFITDDAWALRGGTWLLVSSAQVDVSAANEDGEVVFHQGK